jgi:hypothetical protein
MGPCDVVLARGFEEGHDCLARKSRLTGTHTEHRKGVGGRGLAPRTAGPCTRNTCMWNSLTVPTTASRTPELEPPVTCTGRLAVCRRFVSLKRKGDFLTDSTKNQAHNYVPIKAHEGVTGSPGVFLGGKPRQVPRSCRTRDALREETKSQTKNVTWAVSCYFFLALCTPCQSVRLPARR